MGRTTHLNSSYFSLEGRPTLIFLLILKIYGQNHWHIDSMPCVSLLGFLSIPKCKHIETQLNYKFDLSLTFVKHRKTIHQQLPKQSQLKA